MGCVIGKTSSAQRKSSKKQENEEPQSSRKHPVGIQRNIRGKGKKKIEEVDAVDAKRRLPAEAPEFQLRIGLSSAADDWPSWLVEVAGHAIKDWKPRCANTFEKLDKIGQGTYSNVYKARDLMTGKVVALKKVRFDTLDAETIRFMSREILVLRRLNHPNVIKLEGLVISRISSSLYLVFEYMEHDLAGLASVQNTNFTEIQIKCYMKQLFSGLEHCHKNGVLHRDIKCSNLLIDVDGILKIADFGLASFFDPKHKKPMTSRVVTLWYRPPELLLGATHYGVGVDLWSSGCILAELLVGKAILRGRTEVEQLHKIFKLCGSPTEEYWKNSILTNAALYKPQHSYPRCLAETCKGFPPSSIALIESLLSIDPEVRGTATEALNSSFFTTEPYACEPSSLPKFPPTKELDIKLKDDETRRRQCSSRKSHAVGGSRKSRLCDRVSRSIPAPEANAELRSNLDRLRIMSDIRSKSQSEKFPPPHQDGAVGHPQNLSQVGPSADSSSDFSVFDPKSSRSLRDFASKGAVFMRRKNKKDEPYRAPPRKFINSFYPTSIGLSMDFMFSRK